MQYAADSKDEAPTPPPTIAAELIPVTRERKRRERGSRERGRERLDRDKKSEGFGRNKERRDRRGRREPARESVVSLCMSKLCALSLRGDSL